MSRPIQGDVVQIKPTFAVNKAFAGCLAIISEVKAWGVVAYVQLVGESRDSRGGQAYIRLGYDDIGMTGGRAPWVLDPDEEEE